MTVIVALLALMLASVDRLDVLVGLMPLSDGCNGVIVLVTFVLSMDAARREPSTASTRGGTFNFAGGVLMDAPDAPDAPDALVAPVADG